MCKNFSGQDLRNKSFKGHNLSGVDFSNADIRGANFKNAILVGANFREVKAGLTIRSAIFSIISFSGLAGLTGIITGFGILLFYSLIVAILKNLNINIKWYHIFLTILSIIVFITVLLIIDNKFISNAKSKIRSIFLASILVGIIIFFSIGIPVAVVLFIGGATIISGAIVVSTFNLKSLPQNSYLGLLWFMPMIYPLIGGIGGIMICNKFLPKIGVFTVTAILKVVIGGTLAMILLIIFIVSYILSKRFSFFVFLSNVCVACASLGGTNFRGANLTKADFSSAELQNSCFIDTITMQTCWVHSTGTHFARFAGTILSDPIVRELLVNNRVTVQESLKGCNLEGAYLVGANLAEVNLITTDLTQTNLSNANITGAYLYGTARDDWIIDDIKCDYVYWDEEGKERTPKDRDFQPGEFEAFYKQLPTFEYAFEHGITLIDVALIDQIVNDIRALHPDWELKLDSFHSRGQPHANFTIREKNLIAQAFTQIKTNYEATLNRLKGQYEESNKLLSRFMRELTDRPQLVLTGDIIVGDKNIGRDNIEISGQAQVNQLSTGNSQDEATREE